MTDTISKAESEGASPTAEEALDLARKARIAASQRVSFPAGYHLATAAVAGALVAAPALDRETGTTVILLTVCVAALVSIAASRHNAARGVKFSGDRLRLKGRSGWLAVLCHLVVGGAFAASAWLGWREGAPLGSLALACIAAPLCFLLTRSWQRALRRDMGATS